MKRLVALVVILALAFAAGVYFFQPEQQQGWLGWVEAEILYVGGSATARLTELAVSEGDQATAGQSLFTFEADAEKAQVETARANLAKAEAALALANAPQSRKEELDALQATRKEAEADETYTKETLDRARSLYRQQTGTKANLDSAVSAYASAKAALDKIDAQIALGKLPQRPEQIAEAEQAVAAATSDVAAAEAVLALKSVAAPAAGSVEEVYYRTGEVAPAGRAVVALLPPENIRIEFFVPEGERAALKVGDRVTVACDGCTPQPATISFIARDAEYTPPEIFSTEERAKMVYRLKAIPDNPAGLPVGLPVTVTHGSGQ
ncbi:HlyD family secretion protein [Martelella soudanensis]|uniref:HlyD family secretion protein n=1 Tax=unclassified Martelella TaxID=2629616 RepID=UPI0015DE4C05|nr:MULTISPECIES: HlyD family efflux transporter periplasmic adaptor subunit [unclassified Martelella]